MLSWYAVHLLKLSSNTPDSTKKMAQQMCKTLISFSLKASPHLKRPVPYSISLLFFSTSNHEKPRPKTTIFDYLVNQHQFSSESDLKASSLMALCLKNPEKIDSVLAFLKDNGFSSTHIEKVAKRWPRVFSGNLENTLKPKIKMLKDLGVSPADVAEIVAADPWILGRSMDSMVPSILVLKRILGEDAAVTRLLKISGCFLKCDLERTMIPNIEFLKSCGISFSQIVTYIFNFPRFFLYKPETMKAFLKRVDDMGFDRKSRMFLSAIRVISSMTRENWELKWKVLRDLGFSEQDILSAFRRAPQAFGVPERKIKEVTQLLLSTGNLDINYIVDHPELLICSIEKRIKPRLEVVKALESKNLIKHKLSLTSICKISNPRFLERYVIPYADELGESCVVSWARIQ